MCRILLYTGRKHTYTHSLNISLKGQHKRASEVDLKLSKISLKMQMERPKKMERGNSYNFCFNFRIFKRQEIIKCLVSRVHEKEPFPGHIMVKFQDTKKKSENPSERRKELK